MKKMMTVLAMAALMAGCADGRFVRESTDNNCGGTGWTHTAIHYGDSRVIVIPLSDVVAGEEMRFFLLPQMKGRDADDYTDATITVTSKPENAFFTTESGRFTDAPIISTCIKEGLALDSTFEYKVEVELPPGTTKAMLDPRAVVIDRDSN